MEGLLSHVKQMKLGVDPFQLATVRNNYPFVIINYMFIIHIVDLLCLLR